MWNRVVQCIVLTLAATLIVATSAEAAEENYTRSMSITLQQIKVRSEQKVEYDKIVRRYFRRRKSAIDRVIMRQRGAFDVMVKREARALRKRAERDMAAVLDEDQMGFFARFLRQSESQYLRMYRIND